MLLLSISVHCSLQFGSIFLCHGSIVFRYKKRYTSMPFYLQFIKTTNIFVTILKHSKLPNTCAQQCRQRCQAQIHWAFSTDGILRSWLINNVAYCSVRRLLYLTVRYMCICKYVYCCRLTVNMTLQVFTSKSLPVFSVQGLGSMWWNESTKLDLCCA